MQPVIVLRRATDFRQKQGSFSMGPTPEENGMETELACLPAVVAADVVVGEMSRLHDDLPRYFAKIYIILLFRRYFLALGVSCVVFRC